MNNIQPAEKQEHCSNGTLDVFKIFPTIQGEGPFAGERAIFVRLAGCNLACPLCDTDYTSHRNLISPKDLIQILKMHSSMRREELIVITGGEPFRQNIATAIEMLLDAGFRVQIETNGTLFQELPYDNPNLTIVCSPKTGSVHRKLQPHIAAYKYVGKSDNISTVDGLPMTALDHTAVPKLARPHAGFEGTVYLQPADEQDAIKNEQNTKAIVDSVMRYGHRLCLQMHKQIGVE